MFAKWTRPHGPDDAETWSESDTAPTLNGFEMREGGETTPPVLVLTESMAVTNSGGVTQAQGHTAGSLTGQTGSESTAMPNLALISSTEDSPARTSQWPATRPVLGAHVAASGLSSTGSCESCGLDGAWSRTCRGSSPRIEGTTSGPSSAVWMNSGMAWRGGFLTRATSESPNVVDACSLSAVLESQSVPRKYWLSARAAAGILRRAAKRGKTLPPALQQALTALAATCPADTRKTT